MTKMLSETFMYDIYPKVFPINQNVTINIKPLSAHVYFDEKAKIEIIVLPINKEFGVSPISKQVTVIKGCLKFSHHFTSEQLYYVRLYKDNDLLIQLSVYALEEDLAVRMPLIGDFHAHTNFSDGLESPEFVAAMYRQNGYDFLSITDHKQYAPSIRAIDFYSDVNMAFKLYSGEEIHSPNNHVHIVHFGGVCSINDDFVVDSTFPNGIWDDTSKPEWLDEVAKEQATLGDVSANIDPFILASCKLVAKKVRNASGMCIFAHPHWLENVHNVDDAFSFYVLKNGIFDAYEIIGGQTNNENSTQVALYNEIRAMGYKVAIVGSSDEHGTVNKEYFTESKTLVFAESNCKDSIIDAVKSFYSVALEHYLEDKNTKIYGTYRLICYAQFLNEHYFPLHDELCYEEGRLMRALVGGNADASNRLSNIAYQTDNLYKKYFAI